MPEMFVLTAAEMRAAEAGAIKAGVASAQLMENAGAAVAEYIRKFWAERRTVVLCGPGNNGGDGFVVARLLKESGWPVVVALLGPRSALTGDAKLMAELYDGEIAEDAATALSDTALIVDALFGTGLSRPPTGEAAALIDAANRNGAPILSVDIASGVSADTGAVPGPAIRAVRTVTFFTKKPGHILFPGRAYSGAVDIAEIGIKPDHASSIQITTFENQPSLWAPHFRRPSPFGHKYHRGQVFCVSGTSGSSGAARLAARGALRIGAGLVTVLTPPEAMAENAAQLNAIMLRPLGAPAELPGAMGGQTKYRTVALLGPAAGVGIDTRERTFAVLDSSANAVLDADALTSFSEAPDQLFERLRPNDVITPHTGEFSRLFPDLDVFADKLGAARDASKCAGCVVLLKGADTIVCAVDKRAAINVNAPPDLATAGAGDVLAGFVAGFIAQGMPAFEAAAAAVWVHGACGQAVGPGLIAEDLPEAVPAVFRSLLAPQGGQGRRETEK